MPFLDTLRKFLKIHDPDTHPLCLLGMGSKLFETAMIINSTNKRENISIGDYTYIRGELLTFEHGGSITIGDYCYVGANTYIWSDTRIVIGDRVLISHNCNIFDNDIHPLDPRMRHEQYKSILGLIPMPAVDLKSEPVVIGDDVLISANVTILKGVTIGAAAVIGAGSVVTEDIPAYALAAGNPARVKRMLKKS